MIKLLHHYVIIDYLHRRQLHLFLAVNYAKIKAVSFHLYITQLQRYTNEKLDCYLYCLRENQLLL